MLLKDALSSSYYNGFWKLTMWSHHLTFEWNLVQDIPASLFCKRFFSLCQDSKNKPTISGYDWPWKKAGLCDWQWQTVCQSPLLIAFWAQSNIRLPTLFSVKSRLVYFFICSVCLSAFNSGLCIALFTMIIPKQLYKITIIKYITIKTRES